MLKVFNNKRKILASLGLLVFLGLNWLWMDFRDFMTGSLDLSQYNQSFVLERGTSVNRLAAKLYKDKVIKKPAYLKLLAFVYPEYKNLKAGEYPIPNQLTPAELLLLFTQGKVVQYPFSIIEGQTIYQLLEKLNEQQQLVAIESTQLEALAQLIASQQSLNLNSTQQDIYPILEGWFLPETYYYSQGDTAISLLERAYQAMKLKLTQEWQDRALVLPYKTPYEALIMASIIEKETGIANERARIAGVFVRRLQKRMRLQTDPTIIYGIGPDFNGNITRKDLKTLTPYNTYMIKGLPPTPIAMPSLASIQAALHPVDENTLYFVADGSGGHYFSETLEEHTRAVKRMLKANRQKSRSKP